MQNDVFDLENTPPTQDYEKISYGKFAYKRVQRLRRKGKRRGIDVPHLAYELHKPEKPRIAFRIVAIVSAVLLVAAFVGIGFLYNLLIKSFSMFDGIGDVFRVVFDPKVFLVTAGLSTIPAMLLILAYVLLIFLFLLPLGVALYLYHFVREAFYMAKCSKEEFAKGNLIASRIRGLVIALLIATVLFITLLIYLSSQSARVLIALVYGGFVIVFGGLLALLLVEKVQKRKVVCGFGRRPKGEFPCARQGLASGGKSVAF